MTKIWFKYRQVISRHAVIFQNFTYISILQIFFLAAPLITYPYLVRVLGKELYGLVITAQVVASYCSIIVDFGFKSVCAKHISIWRDNKNKLSEIISSVLIVRLILWGLCLGLYVGVICLIPDYRQHILLFLLSFGLTFNELLFPQFFFQGIEKMKYITLLNIVVRTVSILLIFIFVKQQGDYVWVPLLLSVGYLIGGGMSLYIIFCREGIRFCFPGWQRLRYYTVDASPIFVTDVVCSIKDKLNYILLGTFVGMGEVVIYDLGSKFTNMLVKPIGIVSTVLFPKIAKERNVKLFKKIAYLLFWGTLGMVIIVNLFLPGIVKLFLPGQIDLLPIRLYLLSPLLVGISAFIASDFLIALGYNKYILYSIIITTTGYLALLVFMYYYGALNSVLTFVAITVFSYLLELVYRIVVTRKILKNEDD